ncbi:MAG TPA: hypothetical protein VFH46_09515 [Pyrinomonadaceae bacterium]|nr:hypothetical protein [Pyrinomonadaceae bacterium]
MRKTRWLLGTALVMLCITAHAQTEVSPQLLRNNDVLRMVEDKIQPEIIISKILTSPCNFDVFPPVLRDLRRRGVPEKVLMVMKVVPNGPPGLADVDSKPAPPVPRVQIPAGTLIEVETSTATSSAKAVAGNSITFLVTRRVFVGDVLVIERGAVARARVVKAKSARAWGRAGMLAWEMEYVVAVDGTQIPIALNGKQSGANRTAVVASTALATGALIFPYTSPVALIWGLKKGDEAVLRGSRVFAASVKTGTEIAGIQPRPGGVVYRDRNTVKASAAPPTKTNFEQGFGRKRSNRSN